MSKQQSLIIRGIAILLMFAYHLHDINDSYISLLHIGGQPLTYYINNYCCPIKIGIDYYSFENAFKQANYVLVSKSNPS
jgi:hypothetical protein